jgi:hypothetical protein
MVGRRDHSGRCSTGWPGRQPSLAVSDSVARAQVRRRIYQAEGRPGVDVQRPEALVAGHLGLGLAI